MSSRGHDLHARRLGGRLLIVLGMAIALVGGALLARQAKGARSYASLLASGPALAGEGLGEQQEGPMASLSDRADTSAPYIADPSLARKGHYIDWDALRDINEQVVAWVDIEDADISLPVCQAEADAPDYYLTHDLWGNESVAGCLYVDCRADAHARHALVYGHHLTGTGGMLSALYACADQDVFDELLSGDVLWLTPEGGKRRLHPLCALAVDQSCDDVQCFDFEDEASFRTWLHALCGKASARAPDAELHASRATCAVSLVTCSSLLSGQRGRTVVVLVDA